jgi:hypothetical protein
MAKDRSAVHPPDPSVAGKMGSLRLRFDAGLGFVGGGNYEGFGDRVRSPVLPRLFVGR